MRGLVFDGPSRLEWRDLPEPTLADDRDVLVRPLAVARCDLDLAIALGLYPLRGPFVMGHEMVGEVVDRGAAAGDWQLGQRVIVPFQISCGGCASCRRGHTNACESVPAGSAFGLGPHGGIDHGGALSDLVRVPFADTALLALPDGIDPVAACGIPDNVGDGYRCVADPLAERPGEPVLVVGGLAASVGLYAVMSAVALGSERVVYVDDDPDRIAAAERMGADCRTVTDGDWAGAVAAERFAITVDANVLDHGRSLALAATAPNGTCTSVSNGASPTAELPLQAMYLKGVTYRIGRVHAHHVAPAVLDLVASGRLEPRTLVDHLVDFDDAIEAMTDPSIKVVFTR